MGRASLRGVTLTELMVTVLIMGILAAMGTVSFSKELKQTRSTEARGVIRAIQSAQEAYRAENRTYLDLGPNFFPINAAPGVSETRFWGQPSHPDYNAWRQLAPEVSTTVRFRYRTRAGLPGTTPPNILNVGNPGWAGTPEPWYTVEAWGNVDADLISNVLFVSSFNSRIYESDPGE